MKRIVSICMALALVVAFTACGGAAGNGPLVPSVSQPKKADIIDDFDFVDFWGDYASGYGGLDLDDLDLGDLDLDDVDFESLLGLGQMVFGNGELDMEEGFIYANGAQAVGALGQSYSYTFPGDESALGLDVGSIETARGVGIGSSGDALASAYSGIGCYGLSLLDMAVTTDFDFEAMGDYYYDSIADFRQENAGMEMYAVLFAWVTIDGKGADLSGLISGMIKGGEPAMSVYTLAFFVENGTVSGLQFQALAT